MSVYDQIQEEQKAWQEHNFPGRQPWMPLLGLVEETCDELTTAVVELKADDVKDAVADTLIFMADFCTANGLRLQYIVDKANEERLLRFQLHVHVGRLAHAFLKKSQGIRGTPEKHLQDIQENLIAIVRHCLLQSRVFGFDLTETVLSVWKEVQKRDFQLYPLTGKPS
jgi:NTP pyrophosphatase (non-canonical NTP hydrolase)